MSNRRARAVAMLLALAACSLVAMATAKVWTPIVASPLVCNENARPSDAIIIENFDPNYLLFERAAGLVKAGLANRVFVPGEAAGEPDMPSPVSTGFVEVMARVAHLQQLTFVPVSFHEPIEFSMAHQLRPVLTAAGVKSVLVVTDGFRSTRSYLVHRAVLGASGISVSCVPVFSRAATPETWSRTWHGLQTVAEQFGKLGYYRLYVLPFSQPSPEDRQTLRTGHELWLN